MSDGKRDLGASWSGKLRRRLRSQEQTRRIRQTDYLRRLHKRDGTRAQALWPGQSQRVWFNSTVGELPVNILDPTSEIGILENRLSERTTKPNEGVHHPL